MGSYFDIRSFEEEVKTKVKTVPPKILVVDDSIMIRKQISKMLNAESFDVAGYATNGQEAVDQYKKLYPDVDLVTLDISMPGMDSLKALELILDFDKDAKVVIISALGKEDSAKEAVQIGAMAYIVKPLFSENVIRKLTAILKSE